MRPIETVRDVLLWNTGSSHDFGAERAVKSGNWWMIPAVAANWLVMTASVFIFCAFLVVTPIRLLREGFTAETSVSAGFWCFYLAVGLLYAAVHLEPRYLTPVVPGSISSAWSTSCASSNFTATGPRGGRPPKKWPRL